MNTPILIPLNNLLLSIFLFLFIPFLSSYYFISDFLTLKNFFLLYLISFLSSILFINEKYNKNKNSYTLITPLNIILCIFFLFYLFFWGNFYGLIIVFYVILFIINIVIFYKIYESFKSNLFFYFCKSNNLNINTSSFYRIEILLSHKLFFNENKKQRTYFFHFDFIKILSKFIAFSSLFYYSYLVYNSHLSYIMFIFVPLLSFISYFIIKKFLLIIYFLITPLRIIFNNFFKDSNNHYDCNGIIVREEDNIKTVESKYTELFKPILIYNGKKLNVSDSLWNDFKNTGYSNFLSFLKEQDYFKELEKLKRIEDF